MKKIVFFVFISFLISSCSSSKKVVTNTSKTTINQPHTNTKNTEVSVADKIIWTAVSYKGTPYKYGGTTKNGMDCSGLIYTSFKKRGVAIPRVSYAMAEKGVEVSLQEVQRGDLLFFKTSKTGKKINHVGLVVSVDNGIEFIHSSTSRGVIVSSLSNPYWKKAYKKSKKLL